MGRGDEYLQTDSRLQAAEKSAQDFKGNHAEIFDAAQQMVDAFNVLRQPATFDFIPRRADRLAQRKRRGGNRRQGQ